MIFNPFWITLTELLVVPGTSSTSPISAPDIHVYLSNTAAWAGIQHKANFKAEFNFSNSDFSFWTGCYPKVKELSLPNYLPRAGRRIIGFIPLMQWEMHTVSSKIFT